MRIGEKNEKLLLQYFTKETINSLVILKCIKDCYFLLMLPKIWNTTGIMLPFSIGSAWNDSFRTEE